MFNSEVSQKHFYRLHYLSRDRWLVCFPYPKIKFNMWIIIITINIPFLFVPDDWQQKVGREMRLWLHRWKYRANGPGGNAWNHEGHYRSFLLWSGEGATWEDIIPPLLWKSPWWLISSACTWSVISICAAVVSVHKRLTDRGMLEERPSDGSSKTVSFLSFICEMTCLWGCFADVRSMMAHPSLPEPRGFGFSNSTLSLPLCLQQPFMSHLSSAWQPHCTRLSVFWHQPREDRTVICCQEGEIPH